ncbi:MAG: RNA methyltransferase [Fermentimonas sp.]|nr:RNA methyltransferase [Fermentimonas sp.]
MIAKTMAELEDVLAEELIELGANNVEIGTRMVSFTGDKALLYKTNLHCRTASRILKPIYNFKAETADEVYEAIKLLNWDDYLSLDKTFSIDAVVFSHIFTHSKFVAYKVKDAIADWFVEKYTKRPSVSVSNPDLIFNIHISHNKCTLSLDSSGESLHKRGYRVDQTEAPLSEVLAAGMILKSGWRGESAFLDPMCGSGTILIEAAMIALGIPPGIHRKNFAFEKWNDFDSDLFSDIYNEDSGLRELKFPIIGSDISPKAISISEKNIKNAGLKKYIELSVKPIQQYTEAPAKEGIIITNPPYGERIKVEELEGLYSMIGERLKHVFSGFKAYILSYHKESFDAIGLKHNRRFFLYNGPLECEMREYEIFAGKRNEQPRDSSSSLKSSRKDSYHNERNSKEGYRRSVRSEREDKQSTPNSDRPRSNWKSDESYNKREDRREPRERKFRDSSSERGTRSGGSRDSSTERGTSSGGFRDSSAKREPGARSYRDSSSERGSGARSFRDSSSEREPREFKSDNKNYRDGKSTGGRSFDARSKDRPGKPFRESDRDSSSRKDNFKKDGNKRGNYDSRKPNNEGSSGKNVLKLRRGPKDKE